MSTFENKITLSGNEIKDLAEAAGFTVLEDSIDSDILEQEIDVIECPDHGVIDDDDGAVVYHRYIAQYTEYPEEGVYCLGEPICGKCKKPWAEHDFGVPEPVCL